MSINTAVFSGNITQDVKKFGNADNPALGFSIAVNVPVRKDGEWTDDVLFVSCVMFGKRCVKLADILHKGMGVTVSGSLKPERYTNKDGVLVNTFGMTVNELQLPRKSEGNAAAEPWS